MFAIVMWFANVYLLSRMSPPPALCNLSVRTVVKVYNFGVCFSGELGFLNCDDICMCVVNRQFELFEFFIMFIIDLQYDEISLIFTTGYVCLCGRPWSVCVCCMRVC